MSTPPKVQVLDDFADNEAAAFVHEYFRTIPRVPHGLFWIDIEMVRRHHAGGKGGVEGLQEYFGAQAADFLMSHFARLIDTVRPVDPRADKFAILEFWIRTIDRVGGDAHVHVDTISAQQQPGTLPHPTWSTVYYLGPRALKGIVGGETYVCTEDPIPPIVLEKQHMFMSFERTAEISREWLPVQGKFNRLLLFRGDLPHFAAPVREFSGEGPRITLLVNLWHYNPDPKRAFGCKLAPAQFRTLMKLENKEVETLRRIATKLTPEEFLTLANGIETLRLRS